MDLSRFFIKPPDSVCEDLIIHLFCSVGRGVPVGSQPSCQMKGSPFGNSVQIRHAFVMPGHYIVPCRFGNGCSVTGLVKILGNGELTKSLTVKAAKFTAAAQEKIEKAGGKAEVI